MVTRRRLIGMFSALGLGAATGTYFLTQKKDEPDIPTPMPADRRPPTGVQYVVVNADTGAVVLEELSGTRRHPASLTKMMALAVVFEAMNSPDTRFNLQSEITIPDYITRIGGGIAVFDDLKPGQKHLTRNLLVGAGSRSDAYSTLALAIHVGSKNVYNWPGSEDDKAKRFLQEMNNLAQRIGMTDSHFSVITGVPHADNVSTPRDIARLIAHVGKTYPRLAEITFGQPNFDIDPVSSATIHSSSLLRRRPNVIEFAKTGWTNAAGYCLGVQAMTEGHHLIGVVFGASSADDRNVVMERILSRASARLNQMAVTPAQSPSPA